MAQIDKIALVNSDKAKVFETLFHLIESSKHNVFFLWSAHHDKPERMQITLDVDDVINNDIPLTILELKRDGLNSVIHILKDSIHAFFQRLLEIDITFDGVDKLDPDTLYSYKDGDNYYVFSFPEKTVREIASKASKGLKDNIIQRARYLYSEGSDLFDSSKRVKMFEDAYKMQQNKLSCINNVQKFLKKPCNTMQHMLFCFQQQDRTA